MRISTKGRYSLEAMLFLALLPENEYASTREIAEKTGLSDGYLEQLFIGLRKTELIKGFRGPQGGYVIGKPANKITVWEILNSVENNLKPTPCVQDHICDQESTCCGRSVWQRINKGISDCVNAITLEDLVTGYKSQSEYYI
ncbi:Rrf2 family transcriptional regulator [Spirochaetia bacterium]|nr:Rrf2 family transcriptional regulator [Spirochaetia bacterium]